MILLQVQDSIQKFHILLPGVFLVFITTALGIVGIINTGRNNMANIVRTNLQTYRTKLATTGTPTTDLEKLQKDIEKDLLAYARASIIFHFSIIVALIQISIGIISAFVNDSVLQVSEKSFPFLEGSLFAIMVLGAIVDVVGFITVLFDKRQNPFTSIWT